MKQLQFNLNCSCFIFLFYMIYLFFIWIIFTYNKKIKQIKDIYKNKQKNIYWDIFIYRYNQIDLYG